MTTDPIEIVHLAGPPVTFGTFRRQRCLWCGALIDEIDLNNISRQILPGEDPNEPWEPSSWPVGEQIAMAGTWPTTTWVVTSKPSDEDPEATKAHDRSCMLIDIEVTR